MMLKIDYFEDDFLKGNNIKTIICCFLLFYDPILNGNFLHLSLKYNPIENVNSVTSVATT